MLPPSPLVRGHPKRLRNLTVWQPVSSDSPLYSDSLTCPILVRLLSRHPSHPLLNTRSCLVFLSCFLKVKLPDINGVNIDTWMTCYVRMACLILFAPPWSVDSWCQLTSNADATEDAFWPFWPLDRTGDALWLGVDLDKKEGWYGGNANGRSVSHQ